ncbi:TIGR03862 family flavoprotein [Rhodobacteraceae bacterium 2CG4]|uniref:TIGR03862 family flavoprotein n=1 Tax=Halovulum marinum TaxID=2662447 RepID=A0A6L5Z281_9RHOB|nr:TIGR03862 family flavoprotein [Halovulum marinum]MSU90691.1 TIGR03862 family flavoprotein [Halovulum marinum]
MGERIKTDVCVIGGGPAGLMAAEAAAGQGARVLLAEQKPTLGRKFLMAGKSGLNLTMDEPDPAFRARVSAGMALDRALADFGPAQVQQWARGLGQAVFTGSSGRVFPSAMKASPLLRAWIARLEGAGVDLRTRWRWTGGRAFDTPGGVREVAAGAVVLALGGASWARLGSDGRWAGLLPGVPLSPFGPSNVGFAVDWSPHMARHFGSPVKPVTLTAGDASVTGEFVVSARGIEGSAVYAVAQPLLASGRLLLDLMPGQGAAQLAERLSRRRGKASLANHLRRAIRLQGVKAALLRESGPLPDAPAALAARIKAVPLAVSGPRPLDEAISTTGGVPLSELTEDLMLRARPGTFCAGEMINWDAPTGGYLITTCLATGRVAGLAAARAALP